MWQLCLRHLEQRKEMLVRNLIQCKDSDEMKRKQGQISEIIGICDGLLEKNIIEKQGK